MKLMDQFKDHLEVIKLLVLKNWRIRLHHKISFGLLFLIPICFTGLMVSSTKTTHSGFTDKWVNNSDSKEIVVNKINYNSSNIFATIPAFDKTNYWPTNYKPKTSLNVVYCPTNSFTKRLMERVIQQLNYKFKEKFNFIINGLQSEEQLIDMYKKSSVNQYGVVFYLKDNKFNEKQLFYKLSVSDNQFHNYEFYRRINERFQDYEYFHQSNEYIKYGFCALQLAIDLSHISLITNTSIDEEIVVEEHQMPIPSITQIDKKEKIMTRGPEFATVLIIIFGLLVQLPVTVKRIVEERQTTITDYLFLLGVPKIDYWFSIVIDSFTVIGSQHLIITLILSIKNFEYIHYPLDSDSDPIPIHSHSLLFGFDLSLFIFFSIIFIIQSILFVCFISVFFRSPNIAVIATILIWIISFFVSIIYMYGSKQGSPVLQHFGIEVLSCILPTCSIFWFVYISIGLQVNTHSGAKWTNLFTPGYLIDEMSLSHVIITQLISFLIYSLLIWYLSSVIPFKNSNHKPFYFPLKSIYENIIKRYKNQENYETILENENNGISVKNLSKSYKSMFGFKKDKVLKNIEFVVEKNSITVVLGPNGSGKTTLINIMTGLIESNGKILINGYHIQKEQQMARNMTGICPQQNVYFKFLTLREHLVLFNQLKRVLRKRTDGYDGQQLIDALNLKSDVDKEAINLSGGTLRRMVLAMAMIGPNDILLLDEPTASLDPKVRQKVWDLIIDSRKTKTVLITSHHLEEANLLSDQIIIISNGKVCFNGSTLQMKREFDSGYHLKVLKETQMQTENQIREMVNKFVKIKKFRKSEQQGDQQELVFEIDFQENPKLSALFDELQSNESLAINNISLGMTTLEDSYAKIVRNNSIDLQLSKDTNIDYNEKLISNSNDFNKIEEKIWKLILRQFFGILIKRLDYLSKHYILLLTLIIIPFIFLMLLFMGIEGTQIAKTLHKRPLLLKSQEIYGKYMKSFVSSDNNDFNHIYSKILIDNKITKIHLKNESDIEESLISYANNNYLQYFHKLLYGISTMKTTNGTTYKIWHNHNAYHSLPISMNLMTNALLKQMTEDNGYEIKVSNSPLPIFWFTDTTINSRQSLFKDEMLVFNLLFFMFGFTFTFASYVLLPITERRTKFKLLQFMSGLQPVVYWSANFVFDFTLHSICCLVYSSVYHIFDKKEYFIGSEQSFVSTYLMFSFSGFALIPFAYLVSLVFSKPSSGFTFISLYNIIFSPIAISLMAILHFGISLNEHNSIGFKLIRELLAFIDPFVIFLNEMNSLHQILYRNNYCQTFNTNNSETICEDISYQTDNYICCLDPCNFTTDYSRFKPRFMYYPLAFRTECFEDIRPIGYILQFLSLFVVYGLLYFAIILLIEFNLNDFIIKLFKNFRQKRTKNLELQDIEPIEVKKESQNVSQIITNEDFNHFSLVVNKLTKKFNKTLTVPNNISFVVHKEECFGLLGTNGSGKTTTFRLLTGDLSISSGNAYLGLNADLIHNKRNFYSRIGYCPQEDALLDRLTGIQSLLFFGRIRGLSSKAIKEFTERVIEKFELKKIINKKVSTYSGGNRRKLSLAIALMGNTQLLLLDEPTTGVDPESRIKIWQLLSDLMNELKLSILLTSHNMDECEALCNRLAIVSDGSIKTIGFMNELKKTFAKGFVIILKLRSESNVEELKNKILEDFGSKCLLKYENFGVIHYNLVSEGIKLSQIFNSLEIIKKELNLEDYFVSNASLEQVFHSIIESNNESEV